MDIYYFIDLQTVMAIRPPISVKIMNPPPSLHPPSLQKRPLNARAPIP